jgi:hypothetical protein
MRASDMPVHRDSREARVNRLAADVLAGAWATAALVTLTVGAGLGGETRAVLGLGVLALLADALLILAWRAFGKATALDGFGPATPAAVAGAVLAMLALWLAPGAALPAGAILGAGHVTVGALRHARWGARLAPLRLAPACLLARLWRLALPSGGAYRCVDCGCVALDPDVLRPGGAADEGLAGGSWPRLRTPLFRCPGGAAAPIYAGTRRLAALGLALRPRGCTAEPCGGTDRAVPEASALALAPSLAGHRRLLKRLRGARPRGALAAGQRLALDLPGADAPRRLHWCLGVADGERLAAEGYAAVVVLPDPGYDLAAGEQVAALLSRVVLPPPAATVTPAKPRRRDGPRWRALLGLLTGEVRDPAPRGNQRSPTLLVLTGEALGSRAAGDHPLVGVADVDALSERLVEALDG